MRICALFGLLATVAVAQLPPAGVELANLREDVRLLNQRVGDLLLRVEQLERENNQLRATTSNAANSYATIAQLNDAIGELNRTLRTAVAASKSETLQHVSQQMERLAKQTNTALDSLARGMASRPTVQTSFKEDYPKEGVSYTVQKGDTLALIARRAGVNMQDIINANKIVDPTKIQVGQTLFLPGAK